MSSKKRKRTAKTYSYHKDDKNWNYKADDNKGYFGQGQGILFEPPTVNKLTPVEIAQAGMPEKHEMEVECQDVNVILPFPIWTQIMTYTKLLNVEVTALGTVEQVDSNFIITELFLVGQVVSHGTCELKKDAMFNLMKKMIAEGKDPSKLRFWWHSHHSMGTFWSAEDLTNGQRFAGKDFLISLVSTHKGDMRARVNIYKPFPINFENVPIVIQKPLTDEGFIELCKKEIEENVVQKKYEQTSHGHGLHGQPSKGTPVTQEGTKINEAMAHLASDMGNSGPLGDCFTDVQSSTRWIWSKAKKRYEVYDAYSNLKMTQSELDKRDAVDYNTPEWGVEAETPTEVEVGACATEDVASDI